MLKSLEAPGDPLEDLTAFFALAGELVVECIFG